MIRQPPGQPLGSFVGAKWASRYEGGSSSSARELNPKSRTRSKHARDSRKRNAWEDVPFPTIQHPADAIVRLTTSTICGTDLHTLKGDLPAAVEGRILGHEGIGVVEQVGTHALPKALNARSEIENATVDDGAIVHLWHCTPSSGNIGDVVKLSAHRGMPILNLSVVMQSNVPLIAGAIERMREAAGNVWRSKTRTRFPPWTDSSTAAVSPPMPEPMTSACHPSASSACLYE